MASFYEYPIGSDEHFMTLALEDAEMASLEGEVPVGAIVVKDGKVVSRAHNQREGLKDPTAHAEVIALRRAAKKLGTWRLTGCTLFVTLEPCPMCAGALVNARLDRIVYGTSDPKAGYIQSLHNTTSDERLNHSVDFTGGILEKSCASILSRFFKDLRAAKALRSEKLISL